MQSGYFDEEEKEYVITRPNTPAPWVNYLGSPEYGAAISDNAGGCSFAELGANGRILRYVFNDFDQPGRYIYIRGNTDGDHQSASQQPVGKDLESYHSKCCHGTDYTRMLADYEGIHSEARYFVPPSRLYEIWNLGVTNTSNEECELTITGCVESTNSNNYEQNQVNLQYSQFITRACSRENRAHQMIHGNLDGFGKDEDIDNKVIIERFFGLAGAPVTSYCGNKEKFIGRHHGYGDPVGVESGKPSGGVNYNRNSCDAFATVIRLTLGEERQTAFLFGMKYGEKTSVIVVAYEDMKAVCDVRMEELITY